MMFNSTTQLTFVQNAVRVTGSSSSQERAPTEQLLSEGFTGDVCCEEQRSNQGKTEEALPLGSVGTCTHVHKPTQMRI